VHGGPVGAGGALVVADGVVAGGVVAVAVFLPPPQATATMPKVTSSSNHVFFVLSSDLGLRFED
jgi:hypothetical protein